MKFTRKKISTEKEKDLMIGLISDTRFCREILPVMKRELLQVEQFKVIFEWVDGYFKKYDSAPGENIEKIYVSQRSKIDPILGENIEKFLRELSVKLEGMESFSTDYFADQSVIYLKERNLQLMTTRVQGLLDLGEVEEAEHLITSYHKVAKSTSRWVNPLSEEFVDSVLLKEEEYLFEFPGAVGELIGKLKRKQFIALLAPMKRGKCVAEGSEILLPSGYTKTIEKVIEDRDPTALSYNESTGRFESKRILDYYKNGRKRCYRVKTRSGRSSIVTEIHPFLTPTKGWREIRDLKVGDFIASPRVLPFGEESYPEHQARILGYLIGDGCTRLGNTTFCNTDPEIKKDFARCVVLMGDRVADRDGMNQSVHFKSGVINNTKRWLLSIGYEYVTSYYKKIPDVFMKANKETTVELLKALFSTDGSIWRDGTGWRVSYCSTSKKLIDQINSLLMRFGIIGKICEKRNENPAWELVLSNSESISLFLENINFIGEKKQRCAGVLDSGRNYVDIIPLELAIKIKGIINQNKKYKTQWSFKKEPLNKLQSAIEQKRGIQRNTLRKIADFVKIPEIDTIANSQIFWDSIVSIEKLGFRETYDLTIEDNHNFIADNMLVHNTWWLMEILWLMASSNLRVVFVSLEMEEEEMGSRSFKRLTGKDYENEDIVIPVFDCLRNQKGLCQLPIRESNSSGLPLDELDLPPAFNDSYNHKPCSVCRKLKNGNFVPGIWYVRRKTPKINYADLMTTLRSFERSFGDNVRLITYPINTANIGTIKRDLDLLEYTEGFVPDGIVIDYADILGSEDGRLEGRDKINETWKMLKNLAQERNALVASATQSNRGSMDRKRVKSTDTSEDIRKLAHVNVMATLNQTPREKKRGLMRIGVSVARGVDFDELQEVLVVQNLSIGQPFLDSEIPGYLPDNEGGEDDEG